MWRASHVAASTQKPTVYMQNVHKWNLGINWRKPPLPILSTCLLLNSYITIHVMFDATLCGFNWHTFQMVDRLVWRCEQFLCYLKIWGRYHPCWTTGSWYGWTYVGQIHLHIHDNVMTMYFDYMYMCYTCNVHVHIHKGPVTTMPSQITIMDKCRCTWRPCTCMYNVKALLGSLVLGEKSVRL